MVDFEWWSSGSWGMRRFTRRFGIICRMKEHGKIGVKRVVEAMLFVVVLALGWRYPYLAYCLS